MAFARRFSILLATLFLGCAGTASALQLGESEAQVTSRHGAPSVEDHGRQLAVYYWTGWGAHVEFKDGLVHKLAYRRTAYLTEAEIQALLQANGGVQRWRETTDPGTPQRHWTRDDGADAQCAAVRPTTMLFQMVRTLTPAEAILNESFLQFAAPGDATKVTPARLTGETSGEPVVLSNSAPAPAPAAEPVVTAPSVPAPSPAAEKPAPSPASDSGSPALEAAPTLPVAVATAPAAPPVSAAAGSRFPAFLLIITSLVLGAVGYAISRFRNGKPAVTAAAPRVSPKAARPSFSPVTPAPVPAPSPATASAATTADFDSLRWDQFELLIGETFRRHGYVIELSSAVGAEGCVDLMLRRDGESIPVQCKHWKTPRVTAEEVREFYGMMTDTGAPRGVFVTTGSFTRDAREFAEGKDIQLLDGPALDSQIASIRRPEENIYDIRSWIDDFTSSARIFDPECPCCRGAMVIRHNRSNGTAYWSCATYPRCAGKRDPRTDLLAAA